MTKEQISKNVEYYLYTDDRQWKQKAKALAEKRGPFNIYDFSDRDRTFLNELAREHLYSVNMLNDWAEFRPIQVG